MNHDIWETTCVREDNLKDYLDKGWEPYAFWHTNSLITSSIISNVRLVRLTKKNGLKISKRP